VNDAMETLLREVGVSCFTVEHQQAGVGVQRLVVCSRPTFRRSIASISGSDSPRKASSMKSDGKHNEDLHNLRSSPSL
jgi:hypothetical protein